MNYQRGKILTLTFVILSIIFLVVGILCQLKKRRQQFICRANLYHWASAFALHKQLNNTYGPSAKQSIADWQKKFFSYFYDRNCLHCPSEFKKKELYSYRLNHHILQKKFSQELMKFPARKVLVFDAQCSQDFFTTEQAPFKEIANRHLGGAHLLLADGTIIYKKKRGLAASSKSGWKNDGDFCWFCE